MRERWPIKRIGDIAAIKPLKSEVRRRVSSDALVSFLPMEDLRIAEKYACAARTRKFLDVVGSYTYFAEGDVLLAKITPCFENGKLGIAKGLKNGIGFGSSEFIVLRPDKTITNEWLYYFLSREDFKNEGAQRMGGAVGHQRVPQEFVENYPIPIPPLPEQQRIVGILDEAFAGIAAARANAEKNLQNARALFKSYLQSVFVNIWRAGKLVSLLDLATAITDGDHLPPPKVSKGIPFITIGNIAKDIHTINFDNTFMVSRDYFNGLKSNRKPQKGDVLYTVTGTFGVPVLVTDNREFCFQRHIGLVRPRPEVSSKWLYYLLMAPQVFKQANDGATGTAQKTVSLKLLRSFQVPYVPLEIQSTITENLDALRAETQRLESIYQRKLTALDELKKTLLHQAFTGEL